MKGKILILANNSGGLYCFRKELIIELKKEWEVIASTPFDDNIFDLRELGCELIQTKVDRRGLNPVKDFQLWRIYRKIIRKQKPDLVIAYTIKPNIYGGMACKIQRVPYTINITGLGTAFEKPGFLRAVVVRMYRMALKNAKVVFFENSANRDLFIQEKIVRENQTCLLKGAGVNLEHFSVQPYPKNEVFRFLFIGRIMKEKGIEELLSAMKTLVAEGWKCILNVLGELEENYREVIQQYEKEGWLRYDGYQLDVRPYITECDCFVLPSYHEGMANTNLECAASGRPLITTDIPGCKESVIDGKSGFLCEPRDEENLYMTMKKMLSIARTDREKMGFVGRKHMEQCFDKTMVVQETIRQIENRWRD